VSFGCRCDSCVDPLTSALRRSEMLVTFEKSDVLSKQKAQSMNGCPSRKLQAESVARPVVPLGPIAFSIDVESGNRTAHASVKSATPCHLETELEAAPGWLCACHNISITSVESNPAFNRQSAWGGQARHYKAGNPVRSYCVFLVR